MLSDPRRYYMLNMFGWSMETFDGTWKEEDFLESQLYELFICHFVWNFSAWSSLSTHSFPSFDLVMLTFWSGQFPAWTIVFVMDCTFNRKTSQFWIARREEKWSTYHPRQPTDCNILSGENNTSAGKDVPEHSDICVRCYDVLVTLVNHCEDMVNVGWVKNKKQSTIR